RPPVGQAGPVGHRTERGARRHEDGGHGEAHAPIMLLPPAAKTKTRGTPAGIPRGKPTLRGYLVSSNSASMTSFCARVESALSPPAPAAPPFPGPPPPWLAPAARYIASASLWVTLWSFSTAALSSPGSDASLLRSSASLADFSSPSTFSRSASGILSRFSSTSFCVL